MGDKVRQRQSLWIQGSRQVIVGPTRIRQGNKEMIKKDDIETWKVSASRNGLTEMCVDICEKLLYQVRFLLLIIFVVSGVIE